MPIYEFYCEDCHRIYRFLSRRVDTETRPGCPRCDRKKLDRQPSTFAVSRGRDVTEVPGLPGDLDEAALERAMAELGAEAEHVDEDDPRQAARLMRRMFETTGMPIGETMQEMISRMEAGEEPEVLEEEFADALDEDPLFGDVEAAGADRQASGGREARGDGETALARLRRRLPPDVDPELHEM